MPADCDQGQSSNAFARMRDEKLLWLLGSHPASAGMLVAIGMFPTRKKASKRLAKLARRGMLRMLGTVALKGGRPEHVYARGRWKSDNLVHEVLLTQVCFRIDADEIRRGPGLVDGDLRPDAELFIRGRRYFLELDRGTMSLDDIVRKRFTRYAAVDEFSLWVCPNEGRAESLRRRAAVLRRTALFSTLVQLLRAPHGPVWRDADGDTVALPRSRDSKD